MFLIKYLQKLGFKQANNQQFANHAWYFRNALVRANYENISQSIFASKEFLILFLENMLQGKQHELKNRDLKLGE